MTSRRPGPAAASTRPGRPLLSAVTAALVATSLAGVGHLLGGGAPPRLGAVVLAVVLGLPVAAHLARLPARPTSSAGYLVLAQLIHHLVYAIGGDHGPVPTAGAPVGGHHLPTVVAVGHSGGLLPEPAMIGAHTVAALLTAMILTHTQSVLTAVHRRLTVLCLLADPHPYRTPMAFHPARVPATSMRPSRVTGRTAGPRAPPRTTGPIAVR